MTWKKVSNSDPGDADHFGGDDTDKISDLFSGVDVDDVDINADFTVRDDKFKLRNPANTFSYIHSTGAIAADRVVSEPVLTGNDTRVYEAHTQTLTNKTLHWKDNSLGIQIFDVVVFKDGSTYYAKKTTDGSVVSSSTTAETVINAALSFRSVFISGNLVDSNYDVSGAFTGFDIPFGRYIHLAKGAKIRVPEGYTGYVFGTDSTNTGQESILTGGGQIQELGTPARDWTGIKLAPTTSSGPTYFHLSDIIITNPSIGLKIDGGSNGFVNSCNFENVLINNPVTGVEFASSGGQTSNNLFHNFNIQGHATETLWGFKNVNWSGNIFLNCACWDFVAAGAVEMNILSTADSTVIIGGIIGEDGAFIDQGDKTMILSQGHKTLSGGPRIPSRALETPDISKHGAYYGSGVTNADGILNGRLSESLVGTGSSSNVADSTGIYRLMDTGATINSIAGHRMSSSLLRGDQNCYYKAGIYIPTNTNIRVFSGYRDTASAPTSAADPLNGNSGIALWLDTAVSANWKIMHNDGSGASTVFDTTIAASANTLYVPEIYYMRGPSEFRVVFNGTHWDFGTDEPANTTALSFHNYIENTTGASRTMRIYYEIVKSDK